MALQVVGRTTSRNGASNDVTDHLVAMGNIGWAVNDWAVIWFVTDGNETITVPSGFTRIGTDTSNGSVMDSSRCYRLVDGTEAWFASGGNVTYTTDTVEGSGHIVYGIRGADTTVPPETISVTTGSSQSPDPGSIAPSWGSAAATLFLALGGNDGSTTLSTYPSGYSNGVTIAAAGGHSGGVAAYGAEKIATATSDDPGAFGISASDQWVATGIAVKEAPTPTRPITARAVRQALKRSTTW